MTQIDEKLSRRSMLRKAAAVVGAAGASAFTAACGPSRTELPPPAPPPLISPAPPPAAVAPPPPVAAAKETKREARYQTHPHGRGERCGRCVHFLAANNGCEIVEGRISGRGWCHHFSAKV